MKKIHIFLLTILSVIGFASCSDTEDPKIGSEHTAPVLSKLVPQNLIISEETDLNQNVAYWVWKPADYGISTSVTYTLEADTLGGDFSNPVVMLTTTDKSIGIAPGTLNKAAGNFITETSFVTLDVRIKTTVSRMVEPIYSNVESITFKAYIAVKNPLYIIGNALVGWDNSPAKVGSDLQVFFSDNSKASDETYTYTGFFKSKDGAEGTGMKFPTIAGNWDTAYGYDNGSIVASNGGGNMPGPAADGLYTLDLNLKESTAKLTAYTGEAKTYAKMGVIGSATPNGWDSDTQMTQPTPHIWVLASVELIEGEIKFRANQDWADDWGWSKEAAEQSLPFALGLYKGDNIKIEKAGTYYIALNDLTGHIVVIETSKLPK